MGYTISVGGKTYGPATLEQLGELARRGKITSSDFIWDQQTGQWVSLGVFKETAALFAIQPTPTTPVEPTSSAPQAQTTAAGDITVTVKTGGGAVRNISPAQLMEAIKKHEIQPNDLIWYPRGQRWLFAGSIASLKPAFEASQTTINQEEEYYVSVKGVRKGPFTKPQMESLVNGGHFDPDDQVWSPQRRAWIPLSESDEFATLLPAAVVTPQYPTPTAETTEPFFRPTIHPSRLTGLDSSAPIESIETITKPRQIWGRRVLAAALDCAILVMLLLVSMIIWTLLGYDPLNFRTPNFDFNRALVFYSYAAICILYLIFRDAGGGSIGKRIADLLVVRRKNYMRADLGTSFLRNIILFVPPMMLVELLAVLFNRKGTRIGDALADTILMDASQASFLESEVRKLG